MIGASINQYRITAPLGAGGMGEVFRARDTRLNRDVAIKVLPKDFASDADRLRRFEQEAKTLAALNHPNVLTIHDAGIHEGTPYLVSELLEGKTLREELSSTANAALPVRKATDYALQTAQGLAAAHGKGITHRDLKPENIFVTKDGRVKILDFGLAKLKDPSPGLKPPSPHSLGKGQGEGATVDAEAATLLNESTEPGKVLGTPSYMAPEQVRGEAVDHRADIFAFGCVLYEMVSGHRPFKRDTSVATMAAIMNDEPPELAESLPNISPALNQITRRCLEKSPERRFQSASDLGFALKTLSGSTTVSRSIRAQRQQAPRSFQTFLFAAASLAAVSLAFMVGRTFRPVTVPSAQSWRGERLDGPPVAFTPRLSPDGKEIAFCAMVNGQSQLAVMNVDSEDLRILTTNRSRGLIGDSCWSPGGSHIFYCHMSAGPNGVYRISKLRGEERLVVEGAVSPKALSADSVLVGMRNPDGSNQLYIFSPESEQPRALNAVPDLGFISSFAVLPDRTAAIFRGWTTNDLKRPRSLWRIDLKSGETRPFLTNVTSKFQFQKAYPFAITPDGSRFVFVHTTESLHRVFWADMTGSGTINALLPLTAVPTSLEVDATGNLYVDQTERPNEILRRAGATVERFSLPPTDEERGVLPLPRNRFLFASSKKGGSRLMVLELGKEPQPFLVGARFDSSAPFARLGSNQVIFLVHDGSRFVLATASLEGRGIKLLEQISWAVRPELAMAGAADGKTVYYASGGFIYSLPVAGGNPVKLCAGHSVAVDPHGQFLVAKVTASENYLIRYSFSNATEERIPISARYPLSVNPLGSNAVGPGGRILVPVAPLDSWFWPAAILDPRSGEMELATEYQADMYASGWDDDGRVITSAMFFRSSIWRFRPEN